jgi:hypothetical protein
MENVEYKMTYFQHKGLLHPILYGVLFCDFYHIDGDLLPVPWSIGLTWGDTFSWSPFLYMALDHLMDGGPYFGESHFSLVG